MVITFCLFPGTDEKKINFIENRKKKILINILRITRETIIGRAFSGVSYETERAKLTAIALCIMPACLIYVRITFNV